MHNISSVWHHEREEHFIIIITCGNLLEKEFFQIFCGLKMCVTSRTCIFLAVTFRKHWIPEPISLNDILHVRWFLTDRKYAITGRVQTRTFLKGGASPPALDNHAAATEEDQIEPGNVAFKFQPQNNRTTIRGFTKVFWSLKQNITFIKSLAVLAVRNHVNNNSRPSVRPQTCPLCIST